MILAILLPVLLSVVVSLVNGEIGIRRSVCPPHTWSQNLMSQQLVCLTCNKINILDTKFNNYRYE